MRRRSARKQAFLLLYQSDVNESSMGDAIERWSEYRGEPDAYAIRLTSGVEREKEELDRMLTGVSVGWPVHRMTVIDRAIMRLALFEMLHVEDVPAEVAINEAVEIATGFSGDESPSFVGGVLRGAKSQFGEKVEHG
ncbi:MAG: transcription antitermination factor NusB [Actinomycetota bacterium]|nr:transcription antitermination factor NusB [Actinomycetota bacterium]